MNLENFESVNKLVSIRKNCQKAIVNLEKYLKEEIGHQDVGGLDGFNKGYNAFFGKYGKYGDGSGTCVVMDGCYVGIEAANALIDVLDCQIQRIDIELHSLGVETVQTCGPG